MVISQFKVDLTNGDGFQVDYLKLFADRKIDGSTFDDSERAVFIGYMGTLGISYAMKKLDKISDLQMQGGAFISILPDSRIRTSFEYCLEHRFYNQLGTVLINKNTHDYLEQIVNNPDTYHMSYEEVINDITRLAHGITPLNPTIETLAQNDEFNYEIAKSFGKSVDVNGNVILQTLSADGQVLTYVDSSGVTRPLMYQWWNNFRHSKVPRSGTYNGNMYTLKVNHLFANLLAIRHYYSSIPDLDLEYIPDWVLKIGWDNYWLAN